VAVSADDARKVTNPKNENLADLNLREWAIFAPLIALCFWIGLYPKPLFEILDKPVAQIVQRVRPEYYQKQQAQTPPQPAASGAESTVAVR